MCDEKMGMFSRGNTCKRCTPLFPEWTSIKENISSLQTMSDEQLLGLEKFGTTPLCKLYDKLYTNFESDKELDENELATLNKIQNKLHLSNSDIDYTDKILPYVYVNELKKTGALPIIDPAETVGQPILLKKNEVAHFACSAILKEIRVVNLGFEGGSRGYSIRIAKGVSYRVGSFKGHAIKENQWVPISQGYLVITNQRIMLVPTAGGKQVDVPIAKINNYQCFSNGFQLYKMGREKGFFFDIRYGFVEIASIILGELTNNDK